MHSTVYYRTMLSLSQSNSQSQRQRYSLYQEDFKGYNAWYHAALKAFKKFLVGTRCFSTCNVERLRTCNRLGSEKVMSLWRTTFFSQAPFFAECRGVIFSDRPGTELAHHFRHSVGAEWMYIVKEVGTGLVINPRTGEVEDLDTPILFASSEQA